MLLAARQTATWNITCRAAASLTLTSQQLSKGILPKQQHSRTLGPNKRVKPGALSFWTPSVNWILLSNEEDDDEEEEVTGSALETYNIWFDPDTGGFTCLLPLPETVQAEGQAIQGKIRKLQLQTEDENDHVY